MKNQSPSLIRAARACGRAWADNGATCDPSDLELTAEDCSWIKNKHPRAYAKHLQTYGIQTLEDACRDAYAKAIALTTAD